MLTNALISGGNASDFKIDTTTTSCMLTPGSVLYAGQTCGISIIFTPSAAGGRSSTLTLLDNTVNGANYVTLVGLGTLPAPTLKITSPTSGQSFTSGTAVTFSASVTYTASPQPTGTVQFKVDGANYGSYTSATFDAEVDSAVNASTLDRARPLYKRAYQTMIDDAPAIWIYEPRTVIGIHARIQPSTIRADAWWSNLADWSIPANARIARDRIPVSASH